MNWGRYAFDEMHRAECERDERLAWRRSQADRREQNERLRAAGLITPAEYREAMQAIDAEDQP